MQIVYYPHPALRYKSRPVTQVDQELRRIVAEMFELMYEAKGVGLAANQVAVPYQVFVLNIKADPAEKGTERVFLNPRITVRKGVVEDEEGCLSIPGIYANVRRAKKIKIEAYDLEGNPVVLEEEDLPARAIQHEVDHLNGQLFIDKLTTLGKISVALKLKDFERQFRRAQERKETPSNAEIAKALEKLVQLGIHDSIVRKPAEEL